MVAVAGAQNISHGIHPAVLPPANAALLLWRIQFSAVSA